MSLPQLLERTKHKCLIFYTLLNILRKWGKQSNTTERVYEHLSGHHKIFYF